VNTTCGGSVEVSILQQQVCHTALCIKWHIAAKSYDLIAIRVQTPVLISVPSPQVQSGWSMMLVTLCNGAMPLRCRLQLTTPQSTVPQPPQRHVLRHAHFVLMASAALMRRGRTNRKRRLSISSCLSVRRRVSARFPPQGFSLNFIFETFKKILRKSLFFLNWTKLPVTLHEATTQYACTVSSNTIYFVVRQQNKGHPLVRFHSDTEHFYIAKRNM
jgi:hypothetical protein